jgi:hypothetical protein
VETNFIQIMCEKRDKSTPEVSVFGSENNMHPAQIYFNLHIFIYLIDREKKGQ